MQNNIWDMDVSRPIAIHLSSLHVRWGIGVALSRDLPWAHHMLHVPVCNEGSLPISSYRINSSLSPSQTWGKEIQDILIQILPQYLAYQIFSQFVLLTQC